MCIHSLELNAPFLRVYLICSFKQMGKSFFFLFSFTGWLVVLLYVALVWVFAAFAMPISALCRIGTNFHWQSSWHWQRFNFSFVFLLEFFFLQMRTYDFNSFGFGKNTKWIGIHYMLSWKKFIRLICNGERKVKMDEKKLCIFYSILDTFISHNWL